MLRYYMTPETRQAVIAESNRLIAMRAATNDSRARRDADRTGANADDDALESDAEAEWPESGSESAFARLVADLQSTAPRISAPAAPG